MNTPDSNRISRRSFFKLAGSGLAFASAGAIAGCAAPAPAPAAPAADSARCRHLRGRRGSSRG